MRRAVILSLMALLLFAVAAWSGFYVASRVAPERLRAETERRLAHLLGVDVRIEETRISLRWGLVLEARGVEVVPVTPGGRLQVERASARLDPGALLMARFRLDRLTLEGAALHLERKAKGEAGADEPGLQEAIAWLEQAARSLLEKPLPIRTLELERGSVLFSDASVETPFAIRVTGMRGLARQASFRRRKELSILGHIQDAGAERGAIRLRVEADRSVRATLSFAPLDLAVLGPYASHLGVAPDLSGTAEGTLRWEYQPGEPQTLNLRLDGSGARASLLRSGTQTPFAIAVERSTLAARIEASRDVLRLKEGEISDGRLTLRADGSLALPVGPRAGLRLALQLVELPLAEIGEALAYLPPELRGGLDPLSRRVEAGRLIALRAEALTTLAGLRELIATRFLGRRGELSVEIEVADARLRLGENADRLAELSGRASWTGDALELRDVRGRLGDRVIPKLDVAVQGLAEIRDPDELNCVRPVRTQPVPGYSALQRWFRSHRKPGSKRSWTRLGIEAEWLLHPALLCSVEHALAEITPGPDGFDVDLPHGVWAGIPIRGSARFRRVPEERVSVEMSVGAPFEPMWLEPPEEAWAKGRWQFDTTRLGGWQMRGASGQFRMLGSTLRLEQSALHLAPLGDLEGNARVELGSAEELPFRIEAFVQKMDVEDMLISAGREEELLSGRLLGAGVVSGHLHEGRSLLADAEGMISLHAREGVVQKELPPFVAIAVASDRFNPFRGRDEMPYTAIDLVARLAGGRFHSDAFTMYAPSLRVAVSGEAGAVAPHDVEAVMGIFFFRTLDALINRVPVLNRVILGRDKNLVGAYFAMTGTWSEPKANLIPVKSFAEGPVHFMIEGPSFVWNGLRRLESLLSGASSTPAKPAEVEPES